jgi:hypothetical protein
MSLLELWFYFVGIPGIGSTAKFLAFVFASLSVIGTIGWCVSLDCHDDETVALRPKILGFTKLMAVLFTVVVLLANMLPNEKQVLYLAGGYAATNSEEVRKLPNNILGAANTYLESLKQDLTKPEPESKKK